jgi:hypothetical protein
MSKVVIRMTRAVDLAHDIDLLDWIMDGVNWGPGAFDRLGKDVVEVLDSKDLDKIPSDSYILLGEIE